MKAITKYVAGDGSEFKDESACRHYEDECEEIKRALSNLVPRPELPGCGFQIGAGYVQQTAEGVRACMLALLHVAKRHTEHHWIDKTMAGEDIHPSYAGRIISEVPHEALNRAWYRVMCIDKHYREWGQPYHANNPGEAKQICFNPA